MKQMIVAVLLVFTTLPANADGKICGGLMGAQCGKKEFCNFPKAAMCGAADATGTCKRKPTAVTKEYRPVCGCDDKTYPNWRSANAKGVSVAHDGKCKLAK